MTLQNVSLNDRFDLNKSPVLLNGTQALVRLMLMQKARDHANGLNTAGYVTGYRGSPLGAVDMQMGRAEKHLRAADIRFQAGLNEDLAATALWGTQQAELRGEGKFDGVFGLWYGKGPGVDRSGDVMRHANMAGTSPNGGVIMAMGDDHTGESSTVCHQSDWALVDTYMPVLSPAGVQEILDFGLYGYALSRFAGVWAGLKLMKDTVEVTSIVDGRPDRMKFVTPDFDMPPDGLNIRLADHWIQQEARMIDYKRFAAEAFSRANRMDKRVWGKPGAKIGFVAAGKNWLDLTHALSLLGVDGEEAERLGITTYKVAQTFPLDMSSFHEWAEGLELIVVVEEKRKLIEVQIKEAIFDDRRGRRVYGWYKGGAGRLHREELFPTRMALDPVLIAEKIGEILTEEGRGTENVKARLAQIAEARRADNAEDYATRLPYFCAGCPHNTSTKLPDGSRAYAGIGCHIMATWMDRETVGYTHMGGEGANWIGEAPFSTTDHVFQNIGDGTYNHSGLLAIRAAVAAGVNVTYKILFNDAVAMTGGQANDGGLTADNVVRELWAASVRHLRVVYDEKEEIDFNIFPKATVFHPRSQLKLVQEELKEIKGVSAIVYVQTCAAEKRRRRKRGEFPDPDNSLFIDTDVCEGCGDCGVQSNCVAVVPVDTELGRKRAIDQSACNKDYSCLNGFCPSFVTVTGGKLRQGTTAAFDIPELPLPLTPAIQGTHNIVITGVGGSGVVTIGAILAQAAHLDGMGAGVMEMAGLAQKGGAVHIHCRLAERPEDISAIRVATGEADAVIGGDLVTTAGSKTIGLMRAGQTRAVVNSHEIITGEFTRDTEFRIPSDRLRLSLKARLGDGLQVFDANDIATSLLGDSIFANMLMLGAAWQRGLVPLSAESILAAIRMNGAMVEGNSRAFALGRWAGHDVEAVMAKLPAQVVAMPKTVEEQIAFRADHLVVYQSRRLARKYRKLVALIEDDGMRGEVAKSYHKLLSYKDEYEVARLLKDTETKAREVFDGEITIKHHLAPPIFGGTGPDGRPRKRAFGPWVRRIFPILAALRRLRGTPLDVFGYSAERKEERRLIRQYELDVRKFLLVPEDGHHARLTELARLPMSIRGFGPVKAANIAAAEVRRAEILSEIRDGRPAPVLAAE